MGQTMFTEQDATLLREALRDPFAVLPQSAVYGWFRSVSERCHLWTFHPWSYAKYQKSELPSTHPLGTIIRSILRDEGQAPDRQNLLTPLSAEVDRRRT